MIPGAKGYVFMAKESNNVDKINVDVLLLAVNNIMEEVSRAGCPLRLLSYFNDCYHALALNRTARSQMMSADAKKMPPWGRRLGNEERETQG